MKIDTKSISYLYLLFFFLIPIMGMGQIYPVQVTPQLIPPYNLKLADYGTSNKDQLIINILLKDITDFNRKVNLRFSLTSSTGVSVKNTAIIQGVNSITIDGGIPLRLSNIDLRPYFQFENLIGITPQQYGSPLPDGLYQFCFEVFDAITGQQISNKGCANVFLTLNDPPILNSPLKAAEVHQRDPQNIIFQWSPRHLNATNVEYEFTIVEVWDNNIDPQTVFLNSPPLFKNKTPNTTLLYGPGETMLLPNKKYAWRVRAVVTDGISENSVFKNNGYSEIFHFTHIGICYAPDFLLTQSKSKTTQLVQWKGKEHILYKVQFRKKGIENAVWFDIDTRDEKVLLENLESNTTYQYRVGGQCQTNGDFKYSNILDFNTIEKNEDAEGDYSCGTSPVANTNINIDPIENLSLDESFKVGDFTIVIKEITNNKGSFTGAGYTKIPYLLNSKIKVTFENVKINTDKRLFEGFVKTNFNIEDGKMYDVKEEYDKLKNMVGNTITKIEAAIQMVKDKITGSDDLKKIIASLEHQIPVETINELKNIQTKIAAQEEILKTVTNPEDKKAIEHKISELNTEFSQKIETIKNTLSSIIQQAITKFYTLEKKKESTIITQYNPIYNSKTTSNTTKSDLSFEREFQISMSQLPADVIQQFKIQEQYHQFYALKTIAENVTNNELVKKFIDTALETEIDLIKILSESKNKGDNESQTIDVLTEKIKTAIEKIIESSKYNY